VSNDNHYRLHWHEGAKAQLELFSPVAQAAQGVYQLKYTPPFRSTMRPPAEEIALAPDELKSINDQLNRLIGSASSGQAVRAAAEDTGPPAAVSMLNDLGTVGGQLLDLIVPRYIQTDLRIGNRFLEVGVDESLLGYPWELMHDGDEFLCLKQYMGRFVNTTRASIPARDVQAEWVGSRQGPLSILVISVPRPQPRGNVIYEPLTGVEAETQALIKLLSQTPGVKTELLSGKHATYTAVWRALRSGVYQIVHYGGHAHFNNLNPKLSALVLYDQDMTTGPIANYFSRTPPVLCFINACESGSANSGDWKDRYNIFGVARAFLETGAYLLGSRWKLSDEAAAAFAVKFYSCAVKECKSIGQSVLEARLACKNAAGADLAWASYVFYGDPSLCFRKIEP
jgi:hypothetical protein